MAPHGPNTPELWKHFLFHPLTPWIRAPCGFGKGHIPLQLTAPQPHPGSPSAKIPLPRELGFPFCSLCRWKANKPCRAATALQCLTSLWGCDIAASSARPPLTPIQPLKPHMVTQARGLFSPIKEPQPERLLGDLCSALSPRIECQAADGPAPGFIPRRSFPASPGSLLPSGRRGGEGSTPNQHLQGSLGRAVGAAGVLSACCSVVRPPCMQLLLPKNRRSQTLGFLPHTGTFLYIMPVQAVEGREE